MTANEFARVQSYLRSTFANSGVTVQKPAKPGAPIEVEVNGEFIGVLHRDADEGEVSYSLVITILEEDLPAASAVAPRA